MADFTLNWVSMALLSGPLAIYSERRFQELTQLPPETQHERLPALSIIIPARNEASNLEKLLPSLNDLDYPGTLEIIVVDDNSTDQTTSVALKQGTKVIQLKGLIEGWTGKSLACHRGALAASGEWLLLTDADTVHQSNGPKRAVAFAIDNNLDGLSIFIKQMPNGILDGAALAAAFAGLFSGLRVGTPIINGQYILIKKNVYEESGGFSTASAEPLEDLALGHYLSEKGYHVPLLRSDDAASVQMYADRSSMWQGLTRIGAGSLSWLGARSIISTLEITAVMSPMLAIINALRQRKNRKWALLSWLTVAASFIPWARRFGSPWLALLAPMGALVVQVAAVWGLVRKLLGKGAIWKGRQV